MKVKYYMDEHVPSSVTQGLRQRNVDVLTAQEDGKAGCGDAELLDRATALSRVMFTRDVDFLVEATNRQRQGTEFGGVVYAHQLRVPIGQCIDQLELIAAVLELDEVKNRVLYLPLQ